jgi:hypothetical protein
MDPTDPDPQHWLSSSFMLEVWGASNMAVLLKARTLAHRRRAEWEEWAVRKHGSLQTAFSNPRYQLSVFSASPSVKPGMANLQRGAGI